MFDLTRTKLLPFTFDAEAKKMAHVILDCRIVLKRLRTSRFSLLLDPASVQDYIIMSVGRHAGLSLVR